MDDTRVNNYFEVAWTTSAEGTLDSQNLPVALPYRAPQLYPGQKTPC